MTKNRQKLLLFGGALLLAVLAVILFGMGKNTLPPPSDSSYYEGPWVNKKGDLVDTRTGKILQKNYKKVPQSSRIKIE